MKEDKNPGGFWYSIESALILKKEKKKNLTSFSVVRIQTKCVFLEHIFINLVICSLPSIIIILTHQPGIWVCRACALLKKRCFCESLFMCLCCQVEVGGWKAEVPRSCYYFCKTFDRLDILLLETQKKNQQYWRTKYILKDLADIVHRFWNSWQELLNTLHLSFNHSNIHFFVK